jgi:hypothetical protein
MTLLNAFPHEILDNILNQAAELIKKEGVTFTFGLSQPSQERKLQKYVRGPVPPELQRWDAVQSLRRVCSRWHEWSLEYALRDVYVKSWRGSERWCDLSIERSKLYYHDERTERND